MPVQFKACLSFLPSFELNSISRMSNYIHEECLLEFGSDLLCKFHSLKEERERRDPRSRVGRAVSYRILEVFCSNNLKLLICSNRSVFLMVYDLGS